MKNSARFVPALGRAWLTPYYDLVVRSTTRERRFKRALIEQAALETGQRVLDLATGTGTLAIWMKEQHPSLDIAAVDGDPAILAMAARKAMTADAMGWTPPHTYGIECQTGDVKQPVTE